MRVLFKILRGVLPVLVIGGCGLALWWLLANPPEQKSVIVKAPLVKVEGTVLRKVEYELKVRSQGSVQPRTRSSLLPEVSGKILEMNASFRPGGFFTKGEVLMKLDPIDYETAAIIAQADQAAAEVIVAEESARAEQARDNWKALGRTGQPSELALRTPQLSKAQADVSAAKARVEKARRDVERTVIRAPYDGQVLQQSVDVGQFVGTGTVLGSVFAIDYVEIRLPLPERESRYLKLPQIFRKGAPSHEPVKVELRSTMAGKPVHWQGRIVRVEGALDESTRQTTAIAQVDDPYAPRQDGVPPLITGSFVEAEILGDPLPNVYVIPRGAVRAGNEIILITANSTLKRLIVDPLVGTETHIVIAADSPKSPKEGEILCLTPIPFPVDGARVEPTVDGKPLAAPVSQNPPKGGTPET